MSDAIAPKAKIYDLGYKRYLGVRRSQATRWMVITRDLVGHAWKKWWRWQLWIGLALITTAVVAGFIVFGSSGKMGDLSRGGQLVPIIDQLVATSISFFTAWAFLMTLAIGCGVIASDLRSGAFTFYFSRPVRPIDYVFGKFVALFLANAAVLLAPLVVIALVRVGVSHNRTEAMHNLEYLPKALLIGTLGAMAFASMALAFSSFFAKTGLNIAVWCGYYILLGQGFRQSGQVSGHYDVGVIDLKFAIVSLAMKVFGVEGQVDQAYPASLAASCIALSAMIVGGVVFTYFRVTSVAHKGIGGGS